MPKQSHFFCWWGTYTGKWEIMKNLWPPEFRKIFNKFSYCRLGESGQILMTDEHKSVWLRIFQVANNFRLWPTLLTISINDLEEGIEILPVKFASDTNLGGRANLRNGKIGIQKRSWLRQKTNSYKMKFNRNKRKILYVKKSAKYRMVKMWFMVKILMWKRPCELSLLQSLLWARSDTFSKKANIALQIY